MANTNVGQVVKNSSHQTITVSIVIYKNHPLYKKRYVYSKKYLVHDPKNEAQLKDMVMIKKSRPISRRKHWVLDKIITPNTQATKLKEELDQIDTATKMESEPVIEKPTPKKKAVKTSKPKVAPQKTVKAKKKSKEES